MTTMRCLIYSVQSVVSRTRVSVTSVRWQDLLSVSDWEGVHSQGLVWVYVEQEKRDNEQMSPQGQALPDQLSLCPRPWPCTTSTSTAPPTASSPLLPLNCPQLPLCSNINHNQCLLLQLLPHQGWIQKNPEGRPRWTIVTNSMTK